MPEALGPPGGRAAALRRDEVEPGGAPQLDPVVEGGSASDDRAPRTAPAFVKARAPAKAGKRVCRSPAFGTQARHEKRPSNQSRRFRPFDPPVDSRLTWNSAAVWRIFEDAGCARRSGAPAPAWRRWLCGRPRRSRRSPQLSEWRRGGLHQDKQEIYGHARYLALNYSRKGTAWPRKRFNRAQASPKRKRRSQRSGVRDVQRRHALFSPQARMVPLAAPSVAAPSRPAPLSEQSLSPAAPKLARRGLSARWDIRFRCAADLRVSFVTASPR